METIVAHQLVFHAKKTATHMPFFDGSTLVFCQGGDSVAQNVVNRGSIWKAMRRNSGLADRFKDLPRTQLLKYRAWKLAFCNWEDKISHPIITGLPEGSVECSPAFYWVGNKVHLSFVGGVISESGFYYKLYTSSGPDLAHMEIAKPVSDQPGFFGFSSAHHICRGAGNVLEMTEKASGNIFQIQTALNRILRVTFLSEDSSKILITGVDEERQNRTLLYDLSNENTSEIRSSEGSVYKSSVHGDLLIFAQKTGDGLEERELCHGSYHLAPSTIKVSK